MFCILSDTGSHTCYARMGHLYDCACVRRGPSLGIGL